MNTTVVVHRREPVDDDEGPYDGEQVAVRGEGPLLLHVHGAQQHI